MRGLWLTQATVDLTALVLQAVVEYAAGDTCDTSDTGDTCRESIRSVNVHTSAITLRAKELAQEHV